MPRALPPHGVDLEALRRVLVIKLRHHGDVLLSSPVFSVLKAHAPHLEIDALVYADTADMLAGHPAIDRLHTIDRRWKAQGWKVQMRAEWRLVQTLAARRFDLIVHLTEHPRGAWLSLLLAPAFAVAPRRSGWLWQLAFPCQFNWLTGNRRHTVELNLDALRRLGIHPDAALRRLVFRPGEAAEARVEALLAERGLRRDGFVHFHPASRWRFKCWPEAKAAELIRRVVAAGWPMVVTGAPDADERAMVADILARAAVPVVDLSGRLSLAELGALTARARAFVGVDSAPMHLAAACGTPVVALFGPSGDREWGPWGVAARILASDHSCRPCGQDGCGGGKRSECLEAIEVDRVFAALEDLLGP